jgi:ABC-2 type transport system ATP-binding protein
MLALRGLGKDYGARQAVAAIDLDVARGEIVGLLGPNGAGKTTAISMVCGVVTPTRGSVSIGGTSLADEPYKAKAKLGLVPQDLAIYEELSATENLKFFGALYGLAGKRLADRIAFVLAAVGLSERAHEPTKRFSGGMKRRLNIAAGLVHEPEVLVLDEPTVGVDPQSRNHIFEVVKTLHAAGTTVVYTSHYMEEVEALCDRVAIMDAGRIIALGTIAELIAKHAGKGVDLEIHGDVEAAARAAERHGSVARHGSVLRIVAATSLAPVIAAIEATGATIGSIRSREANLETAFLQLTGHALRDRAGGAA